MLNLVNKLRAEPIGQPSSAYCMSMIFYDSQGNLKNVEYPLNRGVKPKPFLNWAGLVSATDTLRPLVDGSDEVKERIIEPKVAICNTSNPGRDKLKIDLL